jgi:DNA mismatch repair protein MutH
MRAKGFLGGLIERALGAPRLCAAGPDFAALGIEVKTIPLSRTGRPRESTFVCTISLREIVAEQWEASAVRLKLGRVLWVPIETSAGLAFGVRRIGRARFWSPTPDEDALLRADWEELVGVIGRGDVEQLTAHRGVLLQIRPKAANKRARTRGSDEHGAALATLPRAFYLRARFTASLFTDAIPRPGPLVASLSRDLPMRPRR